MRQGTLIPNITEVELICLRPKDGAIQMQLRAHVLPILSVRHAAPALGESAVDILAGWTIFPGRGLPVRILLQVRKFFSLAEGCCAR
jgi:hypothetical protein